MIGEKGRPVATGPPSKAKTTSSGFNSHLASQSQLPRVPEVESVRPRRRCAAASAHNDRPGVSDRCGSRRLFPRNQSCLCRCDCGLVLSLLSIELLKKGLHTRCEECAAADLSRGPAKLNDRAIEAAALEMRAARVRKWGGRAHLNRLARTAPPAAKSIVDALQPRACLQLRRMAAQAR